MIFFAVGAAPTYLSMLTRNEGNTSKIVLIRTGQVNPKYLRLGLRTIEISNVFHQDIGRNSISYLRASLNGTDMISQDQGRVMIHGHGNKSRTNTHFDGKPVCRHHREVCLTTSFTANDISLMSNRKDTVNIRIANSRTRSILSKTLWHPSGRVLVRARLKKLALVSLAQKIKDTLAVLTQLRLCLS